MRARPALLTLLLLALCAVAGCGGCGGGKGGGTATTTAPPPTTTTAPPTTAPPPTTTTAPPPTTALVPPSTADCRDHPLPRGGPADGFTQMWAANDRGWLGADGTLSVVLPDGRIVWAFGDTRLSGGGFVHNSLVVQSARCLTTLTGGDGALVRTDSKRTWYWPGQPFLEGGALRLPLSLIRRTGPGRFDFAFAGSALATFRLPDLALADVRSLPTDSKVAWGASEVTDGGFTYVFGVGTRGGEKHMHVARAPAGQVATGTWQFWDGSAWSPDASASAPVLAGVSDQLSVLRDGSGWAVVSEASGFSPEIDAYRAPAPQGPWSAPARIGTVDAQGKTYNAVAHPALGTDGGLLLSANVMPRNRPEFLRVDVPGGP